MGDIGGKIAVTGAIFLLIGLIAVWAKIMDGEDPGDAYKVFFGLCIFAGAPATIIGLLIAIWS